MSSDESAGFINSRHDEVRNLLADELRTVLHDVEIEPSLTPLSGETFNCRTATTQEDARTDLRARGFWLNQSDAHFDIRIFYPNASSYLNRDLPTLYSSFEQQQKISTMKEL